MAALRHWKQYRKQELAQVENQERFFTQLGEQIAAEIDRRRHAAEQQSGAGQSTDFLANLQSLNSASIPVVDEVMREMAFTEPGQAV
jgi:hypothetical protein